jgi:small subunit ribosomal protein S8
MNHPIIDLAIRIKNGYMARRETIESPSSLFRIQVLKKLEELGYVESFEEYGDIKKNVTINLSYKNGEPAVSNVKLFSTPGQRQYVAAKQLKPVLNGLGHAIISTSRGIMSNVEAKKQKVGGELLFEIW